MNIMEGVRNGHGSSDIKQLSGAGVRQKLVLQEKLWAEEQESCGLLIPTASPMRCCTLSQSGTTRSSYSMMSPCFLLSFSQGNWSLAHWPEVWMDDARFKGRPLVTLWWMKTLSDKGDFWATASALQVPLSWGFSITSLRWLLIFPAHKLDRFSALKGGSTGWLETGRGATQSCGAFSMLPSPIHTEEIITHKSKVKLLLVWSQLLLLCSPQFPKFSW